MEGWGSTIELHPLVKLVRHPGFGRLSINRPPIKTNCEPSTRTWSIHRKSYWRSASVSNPENSPMLFSGNLKWILREWGVQDSNLRRLSQQIYSLSRLTASVTPQALVSQALTQHRSKRPKPRKYRNDKQSLEPAEGLEPTTCGLQNRCSAN